MANRVSRQVESALLGRLPLLAAVALAVGFDVILHHNSLGSASSWAIVLTALVPFTGLASTIATYAQATEARRAFRALIDTPRRDDGQTEVVLGTFTLREASVTYGDRPALAGASLEIGRGLTVLTGRNGSGKTTVLRIACGLVSLSSGEALLGETRTDQIRWRSARQRIATLVQRPFSLREPPYALRSISSSTPTMNACVKRLSAWMCGVCCWRKRPRIPLPCAWINSRSANVSAWRSLARLAATRTCICSTSLTEIWIVRASKTCHASSKTSRRVRRSLSRRTMKTSSR